MSAPEGVPPPPPLLEVEKPPLPDEATPVAPANSNTPPPPKPEETRPSTKVFYGVKQENGKYVPVGHGRRVFRLKDGDEHVVGRLHVYYYGYVGVTSGGGEVACYLGIGEPVFLCSRPPELEGSATVFFLGIVTQRGLPAGLLLCGDEGKHSCTGGIDLLICREQPTTAGLAQEVAVRAIQDLAATKEPPSHPGETPGLQEYENAAIAASAAKMNGLDPNDPAVMKNLVPQHKKRVSCRQPDSDSAEHERTPTSRIQRRSSGGRRGRRESGQGDSSRPGKLSKVDQMGDGQSVPLPYLAAPPPPSAATIVGAPVYGASAPAYPLNAPVVFQFFFNLPH